MNGDQQQVAWFGVAALLAMALYPPWVRVEFHSQWQEAKQGLVSVTMAPKETATDYGWLFSPPSSSRLDLARLALQAIAVGTVIGMWLYGFRTVPKRMKPARSEEGQDT